MPAELSPASRNVLEALCQAAEGQSYGDSDEWRDVYIDNAKHGLSPRAFAGHLSALEKAGFYKSIDNFAWGSVRDVSFAVLA